MPGECLMSLHSVPAQMELLHNKGNVVCIKKLTSRWYLEYSCLSVGLSGQRKNKLDDKWFTFLQSHLLRTAITAVLFFLCLHRRVFFRQRTRTDRNPPGNPVVCDAPQCFNWDLMLKSTLLCVLRTYVATRSVGWRLLPRASKGFLILKVFLAIFIVIPGLHWL